MGIANLWLDFDSKVTNLKAFADGFYRRENRFPRIAIDGFEWMIQIESKLGSLNREDLRKHQDRLMFERICSFLSLGIELYIIADGPKRPLIKRNRIRNQFNDEKQRISKLRYLCQMLGVSFCQAPGEGEAQCCRLQREGVVDYVFSNDSDCLPFGATKILMHVSKTSSKEMAGAGTGTKCDSQEQSTDRYFRVIDLSQCEVSYGRYGYILRSLLQGGDYHNGIEGIGYKVAKEISHPRTGFVEEFKEIYGFRRSAPGPPGSVRLDKRKLDDWRTRVQEELNTNKSKFLSRKCKVQIPEFDLKIVEYYMCPETASVSQVETFAYHCDSNLPLFIWICQSCDLKDKDYYHRFLNSITPVAFIRCLTNDMLDLGILKFVKRRQTRAKPTPIEEYNAYFKPDGRSKLLNMPGAPRGPLEKSPEATNNQLMQGYSSSLKTGPNSCRILGCFAEKYNLHNHTQNLDRYLIFPVTKPPKTTKPIIPTKSKSLLDFFETTKRPMAAIYTPEVIDLCDSDEEKTCKLSYKKRRTDGNAQAYKLPIHT